MFCVFMVLPLCCCCCLLLAGARRCVSCCFLFFPIVLVSLFLSLQAPISRISCAAPVAARHARRRPLAVRKCGPLSTASTRPVATTSCVVFTHFIVFVSSFLFDACMLRTSCHFVIALSWRPSPFLILTLPLSSCFSLLSFSYLLHFLFFFTHLSDSCLRFPLLSHFFPMLSSRLLRLHLFQLFSPLLFSLLSCLPGHQLLSLALFTPQELSPLSPAFLAPPELSLLSLALPEHSFLLAPPALSSLPHAPPAFSPRLLDPAASPISFFSHSRRSPS